LTPQQDKKLFTGDVVQATNELWYETKTQNGIDNILLYGLLTGVSPSPNNIYGERKLSDDEKAGELEAIQVPSLQDRTTTRKERIITGKTDIPVNTHRFQGPFRIKSVICPVVYELARLNGSPASKIHIQDLKPYYPSVTILYEYETESFRGRFGSATVRSGNTSARPTRASGTISGTRSARPGKCGGRSEGP